MRPSALLRLMVLAVTAAVLLTLAGGRSVSLRAAPSLSINKFDVASSNPPRITAHVTVAQPDRIPIDGLMQDRFHVNVDGKSPPNLDIKPAQNDSGAVAVAVAIDTSGSMKGDKLDAAKQAGRAFIDLLAPQDELALITIGGVGRESDLRAAPQKVFDLSANKAQAQAKIDAITAFGNTPLWDGIDLAISTVVARKDRPRVVIVATDGADEPDNPRNSLTLGAVIARAQQEGVPVFTIAIGADADRDSLQKLATDTGGQYLDSPDPAQLQSKFTTVGNLLRLEYVVAFDGDALNHASDHTLEVTVNVDGQNSTDSHPFSVPGVIPRAITLTLTAPAASLQTSSDVPIEVGVEPAVSLQGAVRFLVDGKQIATADRPPFSTVWHTQGASTGDHQVRVEANDADGKPATPVQATVRYTDPHVTLRLVSPRASQHVSGNTRLEADVNPVPSVRTVRFLIDGGQVGALDKPPFVLNWPAKSVLIGAHQVRVEATGADGQTETALADITVTTPSNNTAAVAGGAGGIAAVLAIVLAAMIISRNRRRQAALAAAPIGVAGGASARPFGAAAGGPAPGGAAGAGAGMPQGPILLMQMPRGGTRAFPVGNGILVGRIVPRGNLQLEDPDASREHARISRMDAGFVWEDMNPTNPTSINGSPYTGPYALQEGDELIVGSTPLTFLMHAPDMGRG